VNFTVPVDPRSTSIGAKDAGKPVSLHASSVSLVSLAGSSARMHYRGPSEHLLLVRGYGADGKLLAVESRQILPQKQDVDQDFTITYKGPVAKVEFEVAARLIERVFPFSLSRGASAGPPPAASSGITLPARAVSAALAVTGPAAAAPAAPAVTTAPAPVIAPAAVVAPAVASGGSVEAAVRPAPKPRAEPKAPSAQPATARPLGQAASQCVFKPVMTDEDIARCR
jgi:hypothetical protein